MEYGEAGETGRHYEVIVTRSSCYPQDGWEARCSCGRTWWGLLDELDVSERLPYIEQHFAENNMKPNIVIRLGAAAWDAKVRRPDGSYATFDFRTMEKKERSAFHREFMNAFRAAAQENDTCTD